MDSIEFKSGEFKSFDGTNVYYEVHGEGEPLVLVYGIACLMNHWHHQILHFSKTHKVITFDLRGHHQSNPVGDSNNLNINSISQDINALLEQLEISGAHFLGHSFGVPILLDFYKNYSDKVKSMVFINGFAKNPIKNMFGVDIVQPLFYFIKEKYQLQPDVWNALWKVAVDNPMSMYLAALVGGFNLKVTHFKDIELYARGVAAIPVDVFIKLFEDLINFNGEDDLKNIGVPVLVISGEKDNVTPLRFQHLFKEQIPDCEFVLVPYGSHCTQLDFPDYTNLKIDKFLSLI